MIDIRSSCVVIAMFSCCVFVVLRFHALLIYEWSATDILLDIKQKTVSWWFEGEHTEDRLTDFLYQRHLLRDISGNIYNMEHCKQ